MYPDPTAAGNARSVDLADADLAAGLILPQILRLEVPENRPGTPVAQLVDESLEPVLNPRIVTYRETDVTTRPRDSYHLVERFRPDVPGGKRPGRNDRVESVVRQFQRHREVGLNQTLIHILFRRLVEHVLRKVQSVDVAKTRPGQNLAREPRPAAGIEHLAVRREVTFKERLTHRFETGIAAFIDDVRLVVSGPLCVRR